ncbi:Hypothetical Protein FCC1311_018012 [Hondaea fermentalgiana]|uniref:Uncharacterized protein n=1 Tax=Hondaea fermentalgiana TaxID=2315210 RepID=A0A2R5G3I8_9STRA|nr:Hypothetical Protein FCC1311_018012 [Hondaea fermentalgiana]|eukprot:GBG25582.1 Hypothetical Protein FCC1311_018012 [Hondaea fermentalgiana]
MSTLPLEDVAGSATSAAPIHATALVNTQHTTPHESALNCGAANVDSLKRISNIGLESNFVEDARVTLVVPNEIPFVIDSSETFAKIIFGKRVANAIWKLFHGFTFLFLMLVTYSVLAPGIVIDLHYKTHFSLVGILNLAAQIALVLFMNPKLFVHAISQFELQYSSANVIGAIVTAMFMFKDWHVKLGLLSGSVVLLNLAFSDAWPSPVFLGVNIDLVARFTGFAMITILLQCKGLVYAAGDTSSFGEGIVALGRVANVGVRVLLEHEEAEGQKRSITTRIVYAEGLPFVVDARDTIAARWFGTTFATYCSYWVRNRALAVSTVLAFTTGEIAAVLCNFERFAYLGIIPPCTLIPVGAIWFFLYNVTLMQRLLRTWSVIYFVSVLWIGTASWVIVLTNNHSRMGVIAMAIMESFASCMDAFPSKLLHGYLRAIITIPVLLFNIGAFWGLFFGLYDTVNYSISLPDIFPAFQISYVDIVLSSLVSTTIYCFRNVIACIRRPNCFVNLVMPARASRASATLANAVIRVFGDAVEASVSPRDMNGEGDSVAR